MAEVLISRLGELALGEESTKGTKLVGSTLVDGTFSKHRVFNLTWTTDPALFERKTAAIALSRHSHLVGRILGQITFDVEVRKTAAAGTADAWQSCLKACGFKLASSVWTCTTDSSAHKTLTMYAFIGSNGAAAVRYGIRGAMGSCRFKGKVGEPGMFSFTFLGVHDDDDVDGTPANTFALKPTDDVLNSITHETGVPAMFQGVAFTIGGTSRLVSSIEIDFGQTVAPREDVSSDQGVLAYTITDRELAVTIDPEIGLVAAENYFPKLNAGTEFALAWTITQASPARTFAFALPKAQIKALTHQDRNGIACVGLTAACNVSVVSPEVGDDEFTITEGP